MTDVQNDNKNYIKDDKMDKDWIPSLTWGELIKVPL